MQAEDPVERVVSKRAENLRPARVNLPCYTGFDEVQLREPGKDGYR